MLRSARRMSPPFCEPTAGFWPITKRPSRPPSTARIIVGKCAWLPVIFGRCAEAVVVVLGRGVAEPGLQQRDDVLVEVRPPAPCRAPPERDVGLERELAPRARGACAGSRGAGRRAWGCRSSPGSWRGRACAMMPPPGRPMLPSSSCRIAPVRMICTPMRVLRPADGVAERGGALAAGVLDQRLGDLVELRLGRSRRSAPPSPACSARSACAAAGRRSAGAAASRRAGSGPRACRRRCARRRPASRARARRPPRRPRRPRTSRSTAVVGARLGVEAGEDAAEVLGVGELLVDDRRGVGVVQDVLLEVGLGLEHVADDPAEERDVGPGADRDVEVGRRAGAAEARIDVDDLGAALPRPHDPAEADRVRLGHVGALDEDAVRVLQVLLESRWRHRARTRSPDRGPCSSVICGPGSRSARRPSP